MGILAGIRRLFTAFAGRANVPDTPSVPPPPISERSPYKTPFVRSFEPFKAEEKLITTWGDGGEGECRENYPYGYGGFDPDFKGLRFKHVFRSPVEVEWARAFDRAGFRWEYEPMRFDMGPKHFSYTPDFRVEGFSVPDSSRPLYIEVKWFGEEMNLTKYVRFTEWYNCDLLVLAHYDYKLWQKAQHWTKRPKPNLLKPEKHGYYLILRCTHCDTYDSFPCDELPTDDYIRRQNLPSSQYIQGQDTPYALARLFPFGYRLAEEGTFWLVAEEEPPALTILTTSTWSEKQQSEYWDLKLRTWKAGVNTMPCKDHPPACQTSPLEKIVVPNFFLIQGGTIGTGRVVLPETSNEGISYLCP